MLALQIETDDDVSYEFTNIEREELPALHAYVQMYVELRKRAAEQPRGGGADAAGEVSEESEEDEDYDPDEPDTSDASSEEGSQASGEEDSDCSDAEEEVGVKRAAETEGEAAAIPTKKASTGAAVIVV